MPVLGLAPALDHRPAVTGRRPGRALGLVDDGQPPGREQLHGGQLDPAGQGERLQQQRAGPPGLAAEAEDRAEHAGGHGPGVQGGVGGGDDLAAEGDRPLPVAGLAQHRGQAGQAELGRGLQGVGRAEAERLVVGLLGGRVVAGVLERVGQPLVDLGRRPGQAVLQGHGQGGPDLLDRVVALAHARPGVALVAEDPRLEVDPPGRPGLPPGGLQQAQGRPEASGRPEVGRRGEPFGGGLGRAAGVGEGAGGLLPAGQGLLPAALELKDGGQPAVGRAERERVALLPPPVGDLAPDRARLGQVAGQLGAAGQALEHVQAGAVLALVALLRPQLQGPAGGPLGVPVGVHGAECLGRHQQRRPGLLGPPAQGPVLGHRQGGGVGGLQPLGHHPVQGHPPRPGDLAVEGVADQGVPEGHAPGGGLGHDAVPEQLVRPFGQPGHGRDQLGVERLADHGRRHDRGPSVVGQAGRPQQHGVAHAVGEGHVLALQQLQPVRAGLEPAAGGQGRAELVDEEGHAVGPVEHGPAQRRPDLAQGPLQQGGGGLGPQGLDGDLAQPAGAAQLAAQTPDRVVPRQLVAAVGPQDQQGLGVQGAGKGGQQLQGGVVGPLEVVQEQGRRAAGRDRGQGLADGLEQGGAVALGGRRAQLGQQQGQVGGQRPLDQRPAPS